MGKRASNSPQRNGVDGGAQSEWKIFVELESAFAETVAQAGQAGRLVQTFTAEHAHSDLADTEYVARVEALVQWAAKGGKPTPESVAALVTPRTR